MSGNGVGAIEQDDDDTVTGKLPPGALVGWVTKLQNLRWTKQNCTTMDIMLCAMCDVLVGWLLLNCAMILFCSYFAWFGHDTSALYSWDVCCLVASLWSIFCWLFVVTQLLEVPGLCRLSPTMGFAMQWVLQQD